MSFDEVVYLHPNSALANEAIKRSAFDSPECADGACSNLGIAHTTPMHLAVSTWELWGDGRTIATDAYRVIEVYRLLGSHGLQQSLGTAMHIAKLIRGQLASMESSGFEARGLTPNEKAVCDLARDYCSSMASHGIIELCQALPMIREHIASMDIRMAEPCILDDPLAGFFEEIIGKGQGFHGDDDPSGSVAGMEESTPEFILLKPQGITAVASMVLEEAKGPVSEGDASIAIVAPDAHETYVALAPALRKEGAVCAFDASIPFARTSFGRFFLSACKLFAMASCFGIEERLEPEDVSWIDAATDVALSEYAGIAPFDGSTLHSLGDSGKGKTFRPADLNTIWRADRTLSAEDAVLDLLAVSAGFQRLEVVFSMEGDPKASLGRFAEEARRLHRGFEAQMEAAAVASLRSLMEAAFELRCPTSYMALLPFAMSLPLSIMDESSAAASDASTQHDRCPLVVFASYDKAASLAPDTFDEVILCDVTEAHLNANEARSSTEILAAKFGANARRMKLERSRNVFVSALKAARCRFACVFSVLDANADESFPSFALDEFIDTVFDGEITSANAIKGISDEDISGLAPTAATFLRDRVRSIGEENVTAGIGLRFEEAPEHMRIPEAKRGTLRYLKLEQYLPAVELAQGLMLLVSPSAIESYLGCPYKWFGEKVIRPESLDEGFGALEAGNFAHGLLQDFYARLMTAHGTDRVNAIEPEDAWMLFRQCADRMYEGQFHEAPCSGRYVPCTNVEILAFERLVTDVYKSLWAYCALPDDMSIAAMELPLGRSASSNENVPYAGFALTGKVDRVDAGESGFAVLDYKGGISTHAAGESTVVLLHDAEGSLALDPDVLPRHVQSLVYAKALMDIGGFGPTCRAALYTSYRSHSPLKLVAGSYSADDTRLAILSTPASSVPMAVADFATLVEGAIRQRIDGIYRSQIPIEPSYADACRFCCMESCEGRQQCL